MQNQSEVGQTDYGTWEDAQKDYLRDCAARNLSAKTIVGKRYHLDQLIRWCDEQSRPVSLNSFARRHMRAYIEWRRDNGAAEKTLRSDVLEIRSAFRYFKAEGWIESNCLSEYALPKAAVPYVRMPTATDLRLVLDAINRRWDVRKHKAIKSISADRRRYYRDRDRAVLCILIETGCRVGEVLAMRVEDYRAGEIVVRESKGDRPRVIPITSTLDNAVQEYVGHRIADGSPQFILNHYGNPITPDDYGHAFRRYLRYGMEVFPELQPFTLHGVRHYALSQIAKVDVLAAMNAAGHKDLSVTRRYIHLDADHIRAQHAAAAPLGKVLGNGATVVQKREIRVGRAK